MGKRVQFDDAARDSLWRGIDQFANAVRITLGPRGRSVVFDRLNGVPAITRDGIAVAGEIELPDPFENLGAHLLRDAAFATAGAAGDGTSTAVVIAHRLIAGGRAAIANGHHPVRVCRGIERAAAAAAAAVAAAARPVGGSRALEQVAVVAAGDRAMGELVAHALERTGHDGVVTVAEGAGLAVTLDVVEGARFAGGYVSPYFITDAEGMTAELEHPLIAVLDGPLERAADVVPMLEHAARLSRPLLVVAERIAEEALSVLVVNRLRGRIPSVAVAIPGVAAERRDLFADLALLTGATVVPVGGAAAAGFEPSWFGRARRATATTEHTTVLQGGGRGEALAARIASLRRLHELADEDARGVFRARLARLAGGVAVIRAGGANDFERHTRRSQLEDAVAATAAALEEGIVPGGGVALVRASAAPRALALDGGEAAGRDALVAALAEPLRQIGGNAGEDGGEVVARVGDGAGAYGFDARTGRYGDLFANGVVDPAKVVRCALANAVAVACVVLGTDVLVVDAEEPEAGGEAAA